MSFSDAWFSTLVGMFFNQFLPTSVGGDVVRGVYAYRAGIPAASAVKTVFVDRAVGLFVLVLSVVPGLFFLFHQSGPTLVLTSMAAMIAIALVGFVVLCAMDRLAAPLPQSLFAPRHADWRGQLARVARALIAISPLVRRLIVDRQYFIRVFALSVLVQGALFTVAIVFAHKLDGSIAVLHVLAVMPITMLLSNIPISIAGWGVREGVMIGTMVLVGVEAGQAVTVSVLFGLAQLIASLPGGLVWWVFDRQLARRRENKILQPHNH